MKIEKVKVKKYLKAGSKEYPPGEYSVPIPDEILSMINRPEVVEVIKTTQPPPSPQSTNVSVFSNIKPAPAIVEVIKKAQIVSEAEEEAEEGKIKEKAELAGSREKPRVRRLRKATNSESV